MTPYEPAVPPDVPSLSLYPACDFLLLPLLIRERSHHHPFPVNAAISFVPVEAFPSV